MAIGSFVNGNTLGWRSDRPRTRDAMSLLHVAGLLALICLTSVSSWASASDAGPGPIGRYSSALSSNGLAAWQVGETAAPQVDGDDAAQDPAKAAGSSAWPCRLIVPPSLNRVVTGGWDHSTSFRAQCQRLAEAQAIVILSAFTLPKSRPANARISISSDGNVLARVEVPLNARTLELVAHELEHVLEQVDGVNLPMQAALSRSLTSRSGMAVRLPGGRFETRRAIEAGLRVAAEFRSARARSR